MVILTKDKNKVLDIVSKHTDHIVVYHKSCKIYNGEIGYEFSEFKRPDILATIPNEAKIIIIGITNI